MLRLLRIRNLAVIEAADIELDAGFNVLTGETGAGKSIVVEAVGLLLGGRATPDLVRTGETQATIEALFEDPTKGEILVRRDLTSQGRSRAFIDGSLATAGALRQMAERLVELHGQHEHHALLDPAAHLPLIDEVGRLTALTERVAAAWAALRALRERRDRARMDDRERAARLDLIEFQLGEIQHASLKPAEDVELSATKRVLANAERLRRLCEEAYADLYDSDHAALSALGHVWKRVGELATLDPEFAHHVGARESIKSQLEDLASSLRRYADGIDASPARLQQVEDRLALVERLKRKYGPALDDVIERGAALARERERLARSAETAAELELSLRQATDDYLVVARELSGRRREAAADFSARLERQLHELAMPRARFEVRFTNGDPSEDAWSEHGIDQAEFFVSPNPGEELRPLTRIVSGGELSRLMLAIKSMTEGRARGKTLIFDEVDAGIGGAVAEVVGATLRRLGDRFQVICITHLPQIASQAATHYRIEKSVQGSRTLTTVQRLDPPGRIEEISRMIGGATPSGPVKTSAREMLGLGAKGKQNTKGESESR